jgi:hypothetical protein
MSEQSTGSSDGLAQSLGASIQTHPLPTALIGAGLVWLFVGGGSTVKAAVSAAADGLSPLGPKVLQSARDRVEPQDRGAYGSNSSFGASAPQLFAASRANIAELMERQPLLLGAIGLGLGVAMAAAFRSTALEADLLGEASSSVQARARAMASDAAEQAVDVANRVSTAVAKEARTQGLTSETVKQSAQDITRKIESVVGQSADRVRTGLN